MLPLAFGLHQVVEGFVWLGLEGHVSPGLYGAARQLYLIFAQGLLPIIVPLGFLLLERRCRLLPFALGGAALGSYLLVEVLADPTSAFINSHCVDYVTQAPDSDLLGAAYLLVTCGPALISDAPRLRAFGAIALLGAIAVAIVKADLLTSVWCVYVALISVLLLLHFRATRP